MFVEFFWTETNSLRSEPLQLYLNQVGVAFTSKQLFIMCITFFFINPDQEKTEFRLILAFNRDEFLNRPTDPASWEDGVLAGRDMAGGKKGGTWLAIGQNGKFAMLTNVYTGVAKQGEGRGFLVMDYIKGKLSAEDYLKQIKESNKDFSPFNLCVFDVSSSERIEGFCYTRSREGCIVESEGPISLAADCHGLSNHPYSSPYKKTQQGKLRFQQIINQFNQVDKADELEKNLFDLMSTQGPNLPDEQMEKQGASSAFKSHHDKLSSIFVDMTPQMYGTRVQTLILVDFFGNVTFVERSRGDSESKPDWSERRFNFGLSTNKKSSF